MNDRILYAGDSDLGGAAAYLAGVLTHAGLPFDYVPGDESLRLSPERARPRSYVLSDYPVENLTDADFRRIVGDVERGSGLLMIGGWESFHGAAGEYHSSPLAHVLPVHMQTSDDRINAPQPCLPEKRIDHPILGSLPFTSPPSIGGYNRVRPKADAEVLLAARHFTVEVRPSSHGSTRMGPDDRSDNAFVFTPGERAPLLVVGRHGRGRVAAFTSDVAPHWVGGLVDWGPERVRARAPGAVDIEVGSHYAEFFTRLVRWTMGDDPSGA
jgi:hypothetical protein